MRSGGLIVMGDTSFVKADAARSLEFECGQQNLGGLFIMAGFAKMDEWIWGLAGGLSHDHQSTAQRRCMPHVIHAGGLYGWHVFIAATNVVRVTKKQYDNAH